MVSKRAESGPARNAGERRTNYRKPGDGPPANTNRKPLGPSNPPLSGYLRSGSSFSHFPLAQYPVFRRFRKFWYWWARNTGVVGMDYRDMCTSARRGNYRNLMGPTQRRQDGVAPSNSQFRGFRIFAPSRPLRPIPYVSAASQLRALDGGDIGSMSMEYETWAAGIWRNSTESDGPPSNNNRALRPLSPPVLAGSELRSPPPPLSIQSVSSAYEHLVLDGVRDIWARGTEYGEDRRIRPTWGSKWKN